MPADMELQVVASLLRRGRSLDQLSTGLTLLGVLFGLAQLLLASISSICLLLSLWIPYPAYLACIYLVVAAAANFSVSRKWLWHIGGSEWPVFWALCCAIVGYYGSH